MNYPVDLHTHSVRSDGNDTVQELIELAAKQGIRAIALTDHDICPPESILVDGKRYQTIDYAREKGVILIPGIEISCDTLVEDVHIVGLGCDFSRPEMRAVEQEAAQSKVDGYQKLIALLCENGMQIAWEEVVHGREASQVQRKHIFELMAAKGYARDWAEAKLIVRSSPNLKVKRRKFDAALAIKWIHQAGGIAILAHPYLIDEQTNGIWGVLSREEYIEKLIYAGLDGIEASYPYGKTSYSGNLSDRQIETEVRLRYQKRLSVISGGSDYHDDGKKGVKQPRKLGERGVSWEYFAENKLLRRFLPL